jgi:hypothetical protein
VGVVRAFIKGQRRKLQKAIVGQLEAGSRERVFLCPDTFKIHANLWEGKNLVIPNH